MALSTERLGVLGEYRKPWLVLLNVCWIITTCPNGVRWLNLHRVELNVG